MMYKTKTTIKSYDVGVHIEGSVRLDDICSYEDLYYFEDYPRDFTLPTNDEDAVD